MAKKNDWVLIEWETLTQAERSPAIPEDTQATPLKTWVKGYLQQDAKIGDTVKVTTVTGRTETGTLIEVHPTYRHSFGEFVPEVLEINRQLQQALYGGDQNE